jgi:hypothetical protein
MTFLYASLVSPAAYHLTMQLETRRKLQILTVGGCLGRVIHGSVSRESRRRLTGRRRHRYERTYALQQSLYQAQ